MRAWRILLAGMRNMDLLLAGISLVVLVGLTLSGVFARYALNRPFSWLEEIQLVLFVWMAFFGSSVAFRYGNHIAIDVVVDLFPLAWKRVIEVFNTLLVITVLGLVIYLEFRRGQAMLRSGRATNILQIPQAYNYFGVSAACLFMLLNFAWQRGTAFVQWRAAKISGEADNV